MKRRKSFGSPAPHRSEGSHTEIFRNAMSYYQQGNMLQAKALCGQILKLSPLYFDALQLSGIISLSCKNYEDGITLLEAATRVRKDNPSIYLNLGSAFNALNLYDKALECYFYAIVLNPTYVDAYFNCGVIYQELKLYDECLTYYNRAIIMKQNFLNAIYNRALTFREKKLHTEALSSFNEVLSIKGDYAEAFYNRGVLLRDMKSDDEALQSFDHAIILKPDYVFGFNNRGFLLQKRGSLSDALSSFTKATLLDPSFAEGLNNCGHVLNEMNLFPHALDFYNRAISVNDSYSDAFYNRGVTLHAMNRLDEALKSYEIAIEHKPDHLNAQSNRLFIVNYLKKWEAVIRLEEAKKFGACVTSLVNCKYNSWELKVSDDKIRIGFISGDFRNHPVGFFLENFLSHVDLDKFDLNGYTNELQEDQITSRLKKLFRSYKSIVGLSDTEAAKLIHQDGVRILIDLSGHTAKNRLSIFGFKPSPIQVSWLGYCATTGVLEIDYILGDPYVTPPNEERHFVESIKRLPETYFCFTPPDSSIEIQKLPALERGYITFGCFNNLSKMNDEVIAVWSKILLSVHNSRLFLKSVQFDNQQIIVQIIGLFQAFGVEPERLLFEGQTSRVEYLKSYNEVDIALDPFPYPGGATSVEALWMGVPVITKKGDCFISHNGETIAQNSGQAAWIAEDHEDYIAKAIHFSSDLEALANTRSSLRGQVLGSPIFNGKRFARHFEKAMIEMWEDYEIRLEKQPENV